MSSEHVIVVEIGSNGNKVELWSWENIFKKASQRSSFERYSAEEIEEPELESADEIIRVRTPRGNSYTYDSDDPERPTKKEWALSQIRGENNWNKAFSSVEDAIDFFSKDRPTINIDPSRVLNLLHQFREDFHLDPSQ